MNDLFPKIKKNISSLIEDEEGNIPGKKLLTLGTMVVILGSILSFDAFAGHRSHRSHSSHRSHRSSNSHSSHYSHSSHSNHSNHSSHDSHVSHISHTSHSNVASHSNSRYSAEGDVTYNAPSVYSIGGIQTPVVNNTPAMFKLPDINQTIETPNGTPYSGLVPPLAVPASTPGVQIDAGELNDPGLTKKVE